MSFLRHEQIYQSDGVYSEWQSEAGYRFALPLIVLMSPCDRLFLDELHSCIARFRFTGRFPW